MGFPDIRYQNIQTSTGPGTADGPQSEISMILTPSYATVAPLDTSEHIVYDDSFEYTGEISLQDSNQKSMHSSFGVREVCALGQRGCRNESVLQSQSVRLMTNKAYGAPFQVKDQVP